MADLNIKYNGFIEYFDPEIYTNPILYSLGIELDNEESRARRAEIIKFNQDSVSTVDAVKVVYNGSTQPERVEWLNERIRAIDVRGSFVNERAKILIKNLEDEGVPTSGEQAGQAFLSAWTALATVAIPVVGALIGGLIGGIIKRDKQEFISNLKERLNNYTADIQSLVSLKTALRKELTTTPPPQQPPAEAPNPNAKYYWIGGALVLILFLYWQSRRKRR